MKMPAFAAIALLLVLGGGIAPDSLAGSPAPAHAQTGAKWATEFYNNTRLDGSPVVARTDPQIRYNWRYGSPDPRIDSDFFSARWTATINFPQSGWYRFRVQGDDGTRLYVDDVLVWDHWIRQWAIAFGVDVELGAGLHEIGYEYFEAEETAIASLYWYLLPSGQEGGPGSDAMMRLVSQPSAGGVGEGAEAGQPLPTAPLPTPHPPPPTPTPPRGPYTAAWHGEYYNNTTLSGSPALVRDDPVINFDWGVGAPDPTVTVDDFSVRWMRTLPFVDGDYVFTTYTDDGVRVYLNGVPIIDDWRPRQGQPIPYEQHVPAGNHTIIMEYFEGVGGALARLVIFNKAGGGPGTGTVSFTTDRTDINAGECVTVSWSTANVQAVFYEGQGVPGIGSRLECLAETYTFRLNVTFLDSFQQEYTVTVNVTGAMPPSTGMLTGRLIWQTSGVPIAGAQVVLCSSFVSQFGCPSPVAAAVSNINGDFYFSPVAVGTYQITALLPLCSNWYSFVDGLGIPEWFTVTQFNQTDTGVRAAYCLY
jgi:hypothetical protein